MNLVILPLATLVPGVHSFGPFSISQDISSAALSFDRTAWTDLALRVDVLIDISLDGGLTWASETPNRATDPFPIACTLVGGPLFDKNGLPLTSGVLGSGELPQPGNANRSIRGTVTNNLALTTLGTLVTG